MSPSIGRGCHDLRVADKGHRWRIVYRVDEDKRGLGGSIGRRKNFVSILMMGNAEGSTDRSISKKPFFS
jgi:hypothetical protein